MWVKLAGRLFRFRFCQVYDAAGECDPPSRFWLWRQIRVDQKLVGEERLRVCLHEAMHACDWSKDEEFIDSESRDIAALLWRLGYRMKGDGE